MKTCKKCQKSKELNEFSKKAGCSDGYRNVCKVCRDLQTRQWFITNSEKVKEYKKQHRIENIQHIKERHREYIIERFRNDPKFKLQCILRNRLRMALKKNYKSGSAVRDLGCSIEEFKLYLESLFKPGMTWDNHGKWHIDHKIPLSKFDLTLTEELRKACHFTNLQPLWAQENLSKGDRLVG